MKIRIVLLLCILGSSFLISCKEEDGLHIQFEDTIYLRSQGADMPAFVRGNATSNIFIIFLHGGPGGNALQYRAGPYAELLEEKYAVVYWDQRGQGNSHGHLKDVEFSIDLMVEDTYTLIQTLKKHYGPEINFFLMGHSWGGLLGTKFLLKNDYQSEIKAWIEVDGAHDLPLINIELIKMLNAIGPLEIAAGRNVEDWTEMVDYANGLDQNNISLEQTLILNRFASTAEDLITSLNPKGKIGFDKDFFWGPNNIIAGIVNAGQLPSVLYEELMETSLTSELNRIKIPCLLLWGRYDFKVPPAIADTSFQEIGTTDKQLIIYEKSGHSPMRYESEAFGMDIINFIELHK